MAIKEGKRNVLKEKSFDEKVRSTEQKLKDFADVYNARHTFAGAFGTTYGTTVDQIRRDRDTLDRLLEEQNRSIATKFLQEGQRRHDDAIVRGKIFVSGDLISYSESVRVRDILRSIVLAPIPLFRKIEAHLHETWVTIHVTMSVFDRDDFGASEVVARFHEPAASIVNEGQFAVYLREKLIFLATHEIDECIRDANGRIINDPHRPVKVDLTGAIDKIKIEGTITV